MTNHQQMSLEECLREFNRQMKQKVDETFEINVYNIKKYFDKQVKEKAKNPITFNQLSSKLY